VQREDIKHDTTLTMILEEEEITFGDLTAYEKTVPSSGDWRHYIEGGQRTDGDKSGTGEVLHG
jgi:hypothetical protein